MLMVYLKRDSNCEQLAASLLKIFSYKFHIQNAFHHCVWVDVWQDFLLMKILYHN
jgi:hypothetical protein